MVKLSTIKQKTKEAPQGTATLILAAVIILVYFYLSQGLLYIPSEALLSYGFLPSNLLGIISYSFLHLSPEHILANVSLLLAVGIITEKKIDLTEYIGVFLASAATAGIAFHILTPEPTTLVGASSAISGILAISIFVDFKKALPAIVLFGLFLHVASPVVSGYTKGRLLGVENETKTLEKNFKEFKGKYNESKEKVETLQEKIDRLEPQCEEDNQTACEKLNTITGAFEKEKNETKELQKKKNQTFQELEEKTKMKGVIEEGMEREKRAKTSAIVHLVGALTGLAYLTIFRRDIIWSLPSQVSQLRSYFQKLKKK